MSHGAEHPPAAHDAETPMRRDDAADAELDRANGPERVSAADAPPPPPPPPKSGSSSTTRRRKDVAWSGFPLAASIALVAFAVLFGIYGPRVVDRGAMPLGIPLWELAEAIGLEHARAASTGARLGTVVTLAEADALASEILGTPVTLPDFSAEGFRPVKPIPLRAPGTTSAVLAVYARIEPERISFVSVALIPDREQYVVFSQFGRPILLPAWESYDLENPELPTYAVAWSDGEFLRVAQSGDLRTLERVEDLFLAAQVPVDTNQQSAADATRSDEPDR